MMEQIQHYFVENSTMYGNYVFQHLHLSLIALLFASVIGLPIGYMSYKNRTIKQVTTYLVQGLRVIPSIGILFILIPIVGVGEFPALVALVILGIPPIALNTMVGFSEVPDFLLETGTGLGMTQKQLLQKVSIPLSLPHIFNGIKLALVEIVASATLATYIGAGGLGTLIFTGLGLYRYDLLLIGGASVALLSFLCMFIFDLLIKWLMRHTSHQL